MRTFITCVLLLATQFVFAQKKVDLDKYHFSVQFMALPNMKLDSSYRTYHVDVESTKAMRPLLNELNAEETVVIRGWRKLSHDGHLNVKVKIDDLLPEAVSVKERIENIKDKSGKITSTKTFYYQEVTYTFAATAVISDYKGKHIMDQELAGRGNKQTYQSPEFPIKQLAEGYFVLNSIKITKDLFRRCVNNAMHTLSQRLTDNFGFSEVTVRDHMWIVDSRKHPEYEAHRKAFLTMNEVLFSMNASTPIDGVREKLKPVIDYFEKVKKRYTSSSKHDRKIRYASYYNLAVLYYYLDDPQMMMKEASGLVLNDFDARDGKVFEQSALRLKNHFTYLNIYTRHFSIDPSTFKGPYETAEALR